MNKVILIGNLTKDPELTTVSSGISKCTFTVAVNRTYTGADGTRQTDFLPVVCWRGLADNCGRFLKKGRKAAVSGSIQTRSYDAQDGTKRYVTEIVADDVQFLSTRSDGADEIPDLPEPPSQNQRRGGSIENLKPLDDGDLPF